MGYQESFVYVGDLLTSKKKNEELKTLLNICKKLDLRYEDDPLASIVGIAKFDEGIGSFKKGDEALIISGDRQTQRTWSTFITTGDPNKDKANIGLLSKEELNCLHNVEFCYLDPFYEDCLTMKEEGKYHEFNFDFSKDTDVDKIINCFDQKMERSLP